MEPLQVSLLTLGAAVFILLWNNTKNRIELRRQRQALNEFHTVVKALKDNLLTYIMETENRFIGSDGVMDAIMAGLTQFDERIGKLEPQIKEQTDEG